MNPDEYETMYRVEDRLWWYHGLRDMLTLYWPESIDTRASKVLDVGCGTGATLAALSDRSTQFGIDFQTEAIRLCRRRGLHRTGAASALALPFPDATFDVVISCDVLCHRSIPDKSVPLLEMHRVLKDGGYLLLNLPAYQWLYSSHDSHVHTDRRFTRREVRALLEERSFELLRSTHWNTLLFPIILPLRLWRKVYPLPASDLSHEPRGLTNRLLTGIMRCERCAARLAPLPFGLSLLVLARKS